MIETGWKTKSGRKARIICKDRVWPSDGWPIIALIQDDEKEVAVPYKKDLTTSENHWFPGEDLDLVRSAVRNRT